MMTTEEMEKRWPEGPPYNVRKVIMLFDDLDFDFLEVNQESIDEIIEYFQAAKESMNG